MNDRASLYEHQRPRIDLVQEALDRLGRLAGERVVDVGCGNGAYVAELVRRQAVVFATDLSSGMLKTVSTRPVELFVADAQQLPILDSSIGAVLMMHMLYHLPEPALAIGEARRLLRHDGKLLASVAGPRHLTESNDIWVSLLEEAGLDTTRKDLGLLNVRLPAEQLGDMLSACFANVEYTVLASQIVLSDPAPVLRHAASTTAGKVSEQLGAGVLGRMSAVIGDAIARQGVFRITTEVALFTATAPLT